MHHPKLYHGGIKPVARFAERFGRLGQAGTRSPETWRDVFVFLKVFVVNVAHIVLGVGRPPSLSEPRFEKPTWGWLPALSMTSALALVVVVFGLWASADALAPSLFWGGLVLLFLPIAARMAWRPASRSERIGLLLLATAMLYLVKIVRSPMNFNSFDEFLHWTTAEDIISQGRLFTPNSLLPISPLYPALEIVAAAVTSLTGLPLFISALVMLGILRGVFICALFLLFERITGSPRVAGIACIIYMGNSSFMFFDTAFAYESLGIVLMVLVLLAAQFAETDASRRWAYVLVLAVPFLMVLAVTHHVTTYLTVFFFVVLVALAFLKPNATGHRVTLVTLVAAAVLFSVGWSLLVGNPVYTMMVSFAPARKLFVAADGIVSPTWQRAVALGAVALTALALTLGFFRTLTLAGVRVRRCGKLISVKWANSWLVFLAIIAALFPMTLALRLTVSGWELGSRLSPFVFIGVAPIAAVAVMAFWRSRSTVPWRAATLGAAFTTLFLGGILASWGTDEVPRRYRVVADAASVEPMGVSAAEWTKQWLGTGHRFVADRINRLLLSTYGRQEVFTQLRDRVDTSSVMFARTLGPEQLNALKVNNVSCILVDMRLSQALPRLGVYFEVGESRLLHLAPPEPAALLKFNEEREVSRPFDNGYIIIYDVSALVRTLRNAH
jgi:hypothetical protein